MPKHTDSVIPTGSSSSSNDYAVFDPNSDSDWEDDTPFEFPKIPYQRRTTGGESLLSRGLKKMKQKKSSGQSIGEDAPTTHDKQDKQEEQMGKEEEDIYQSRTIDEKITKCSSVHFDPASHVDSGRVIVSNGYNSTGW
ncbi:hypothetical protein EDB81DRAFT_893369 [Dactylonectria macrodidyma]|uniref:Uncharacterized protein n=1 Tax=Dactylonectria macrodidyma TaxID=307937 RepID=A0A9P9IBR7_9HYPO|nr:hypothetical protein EDB81DRAFT_893369 [Dactylonectria macrodidyma]